MELLRIKEILNKKGISGKDLAQTVGVSAVSISNIAQGNSFPKPDLLLAIAKALDVDVRELFNPTKRTDNVFIGHIEFNGEIHKVSTIKDLETLLKKAKEIHQ